MRKKEEFSSSPIQVQLLPEPGSTVWADETQNRSINHIHHISFSTTHPYPEDNVTKLSWGQELLLQIENNLSSWRRGSRFLTHVLLEGVLLFCYCGQPAAFQGTPRKNAMMGIFTPVLNNCSEVFWRCLAKFWHWDEEKHHWREKQLSSHPAKGSLCPQIGVDHIKLCQWQGNKCTNPFESK